MAKKALPAHARTLALAQLTNSVGDGAFYVTSALFYARVVSLSPAQIGTALTIGWGAGFLASVPLGTAADRRGPRVTAILLAIATAVAVASLMLIRSYAVFVIALCVYATCQSGLSAARQALLAGLIAPTERTRVRAHLQSALNGGLAAGAAVGGLALYLDDTAAYLSVFALDALGFLVAALLLSHLPDIPPVPHHEDRGPRLAVLRDPPYAVAAVLNAVMLLYMPLLSLVLPLWIAQHTTAPRPLIAALFVLNTLAVMAFQVRVARRVVDLGSAARSVRLSGFVMLVACAVFATSGATSAPWVAAAVLLAGAALQVAAEMLLAAGAWEISFGLAPPDSHGQYQGLFGAGVPVARMAGPLLLTGLILILGTVGWLILGGVFLLAGIAMAPTVAWARRRGRTAAAVDVVTEPRAG